MEEGAFAYKVAAREDYLISLRQTEGIHVRQQNADQFASAMTDLSENGGPYKSNSMESRPEVGA